MNELDASLQQVNHFVARLQFENSHLKKQNKDFLEDVKKAEDRAEKLDAHVDRLSEDLDHWQKKAEELSRSSKAHLLARQARDADVEELQGKLLLVTSERDVARAQTHKRECIICGECSGVDSDVRCDDPTVERVVELLRSRSRAGVKHYGTTLRDAEMSGDEALIQLQAELLDAANYIMKKLETKE